MTTEFSKTWLHHVYRILWGTDFSCLFWLNNLWNHVDLFYLILQFKEIFCFAVTPVRLKTSMKLLGKVWNLTRLRIKVTNSPKDCLRLLVLIRQRLPGRHYSNEETKYVDGLGILGNSSRTLLRSAPLINSNFKKMPTTSFSFYCITFFFTTFPVGFLSKEQMAVEFLDNSGRNSIHRKLFLT